VTFTADADLRHIPSDVAIGLFRIAQESLRNGVVHGAARRLAVSLARSGDDIELTVSDDGCGFKLHAVSHDASGVGVMGMEERARVIGGKLHISTGARHGTTIRITVPLPLRRDRTPDVSAPTDAIRIAEPSGSFVERS